MKNYFLVLLLALFAVSCSKTVDVKGKIIGGSPLDRLEFTEMSGVGTLPIANLGTDKSGEFVGSFEAPKNGMYLMSYGGRQGLVYLKAGQKLEFTANAMDFPQSLKFTGDAQKNNDFLNDFQKVVGTYGSKIDMQKLMTSDEAAFLKEAQKIKTDLEKIIDDSAKKFGADSDLIKLKKDEVIASILGLMSQYEQNHPMIIQNPGFKVSKNFKDYEKTFTEKNDELVKSQPMYRNYLLNKISSDYQQYTTTNVKQDAKMLNSEVFAKYLDTRKDLSQVTKDYLLAFVIGQFDANLGLDAKNSETLNKLVDSKVKDATVKNDLKRLFFVLSGPKAGDAAIDRSLIKQDGKSFKLADAKGKPAMVVFYASWNPYIAQSTIPVLKEVTNFYKSKMDFVYVNLDDSKDQFIKTSNAMMKGLPGTNVYAEGGINSKFAYDWGLYSFKMPSFIVLDKDGKIASKLYSNLGEQGLVDVLDKVTGLKAPTVAPEATLQNDLLQQPAQQTPAQAESAAAGK